MRLNAVGIEDLLQADPAKSLHQAQHLDLLYLGRLIVYMACRNSNAMSNFAKVRIIKKDQHLFPSCMKFPNVPALSLAFHVLFSFI